MIRVDTIVIRQNLDTGQVTAVIYTPENELVSGLEGVGNSLHEAIAELAESIEEIECDTSIS